MLAGVRQFSDEARHFLRIDYLNDQLKRIIKMISCDKTEEVKNEIGFWPNGNDAPWIMKLSEKGGIEFNRESYPNSSPDDFADAVIQILEKELNVKIGKK